MIIENKDKFNVKVYDRGFVYLTELVNSEWKICEFNTKEEAETALKQYNEYKEAK